MPVWTSVNLVFMFYRGEGPRLIFVHPLSFSPRLLVERKELQTSQRLNPPVEGSKTLGVLESFNETSQPKLLAALG